MQPVCPGLPNQSNNDHPDKNRAAHIKLGLTNLKVSLKEIIEYNTLYIMLGLLVSIEILGFPQVTKNFMNYAQISAQSRSFLGSNYISFQSKGLTVQPIHEKEHGRMLYLAFRTESSPHL